MIDTSVPQSSEAPIETELREQLVHGDIVLGTIGPILGHLLATDDNSLFSDEIVARVRGMVTHLSQQFLFAQAAAGEIDDPEQFAAAWKGNLAGRLMTFAPLMTHCHALALEWQLAMQLSRRNAIDPVLSPLLQALIASDDPEIAKLAMAVLASQARFIQQQRRMELPVAELPGDLFHHALLTWLHFAGEEQADVAVRAEASLRGEFDEGSGRFGLISRLVTSMGSGAMAALSVSHAGVAIFLSALALASSQDRDIAAFSSNERQMARMALALRAAGLKPKDVEEQLVYIHPEIVIPEGFEMLRSDRAAAMLAASDRNTGI